MPSSGYTAITFVANEQPTTAKWNLIGSNDSSFNLGTGFEDSILLTRHFADNNITYPKLTKDSTWVWTDWTPTITASGSMTVTSVTRNQCRYIQIGKTVFFCFDISHSIGGTGSNSMYFTLPVNAYMKTTPIYVPIGMATQVDGVAGWSQLNGVANEVIIRKSDGSAMSTGSGKTTRVFGMYEAA